MYLKSLFRLTLAKKPKQKYLSWKYSFYSCVGFLVPFLPLSLSCLIAFPISCGWTSQGLHLSLLAATNTKQIALPLQLSHTCKYSLQIASGEQINEVGAIQQEIIQNEQMLRNSRALDVEHAGKGLLCWVPVLKFATKIIPLWTFHKILH